MNKILKYSAFILCLFAITGFGTFTVWAYGEDYARVGLESANKNISEIAVGNRILNTYINVEGEFEDYGRIVAVQGFTIAPDNLFYTATTLLYNNYSNAKSAADSINFSGGRAVTTLTKNGAWSVYYGGVSSEAEAMAFLGYPNATTIVKATNKRIALKDGGVTIAVFDNDLQTIYFSDEETTTVNIGGKVYRGYLDAMRSSTNKMTAVNVVEVEDYLCSAVPSEMPSGWHIEAIKAQTVAARSYTYTRMGVHADAGYDLCDAIHCQVYNGLSSESDSSRLAVEQTNGVVAYYNNEIINATFFSSGGGSTDNSENVWSNTIPYLRSVSDQYDTTGKVWTRSFSLSELTTIANAKNLNIGSVTGVSITSTAASGRVLKLSINGTGGTKVLEKEDVRTFFASTQGGSLESRNFGIGGFVQSASAIFVSNGNAAVSQNISEINVRNSSGTNSNTSALSSVSAISASSTAVYDKNQPTGQITSTSDTVVISGKGWGHGVGLSQHGAKGMAEAGFTYEQILKHYYTGIELTPVR